MTAELLTQLETLSVETARLRERLRRLRNASVILPSNSSGSGRGGDAGDPVGDMVGACIDLEERINACKEDMLSIIRSELSPEMRKLLMYRFVVAWSWRKVAEAMMYGDGAAVYRKFKRYKRKMTTDKTTPNGVK